MLIDFSGIISLSAFFLWLILIVLLKLKYRKTYIYLFFFSIFYFYVCKVFDYTQFPIILDETIKNDIGQNVWREANFIPFSYRFFDYTFVITSLLNILLTVPFGFFLPFIAKVNFKRIVLLGILVGFFLETLQLIIALIVGFTFRHVDINDLIFNFFGVMLGYGIFNVFMVVFKSIIHKLNIKLNPFLRYIYEIQ